MLMMCLSCLWICEARVIQLEPYPHSGQPKRRSTYGENQTSCNGEWSAALKFAPRIPKPKAAPTGRPTALTTLPLDAASAQNGSGIASGSGSAGEATPPISSISIAKVYQPDIVRSAEPQLFGVNKQDKNEIVLGADGRPLARAPAMLLTSGKGKGKRKGKDGAQPAEGKKRKKKKKVGRPLCVFEHAKIYFLTKDGEKRR